MVEWMVCIQSYSVIISQHGFVYMYLCDPKENVFKMEIWRRNAVCNISILLSLKNLLRNVTYNTSTSHQGLSIFIHSRFLHQFVNPVLKKACITLPYNTAQCSFYFEWYCSPCSIVDYLSFDIRCSYIRLQLSTTRWTGVHIPCHPIPQKFRPEAGQFAFSNSLCLVQFCTHDHGQEL